jgi:hypothetical protein
MICMSLCRSLVLPAMLAASVVRADDRSIADFRAPGRPGKAPAPAVATPTLETGASRAATAMMPERICLSIAHGAVIRSGTGYRFDFRAAPMIEVIEAVGRIFGAPVACPGAVSGELTGSFFAPTPADVLAKVAERAGWCLRQDGSAWLLEEPGRGAPPELRWDRINPAASAAAKKSP